MTPNTAVVKLSGEALAEWLEKMTGQSGQRIVRVIVDVEFDRGKPPKRTPEDGPIGPGPLKTTRRR
jgi:hypothetical protein